MTTVPKKQNDSALFAVFAKAGKLAKLLKATKFLKPLITLSSLVVSIFAYAFTLSGGWIFAIGFVTMILIHEMGHVAALRMKGIKASAPIFIPFIGAAIFAPKLGDRDQEAYVGYAGPLIGGLGALVLFGVVVFSSHPPVILSLIAYVALYVNAFNLIPVSPLDGGRVTQAIGPWFKWVGGFAIVAITVATANPGLMLIWLIVLSSLPMNLRLKAFLGIVFWTIMAFMELVGIGTKENLLWILFDLIIGFLFVAGYVYSAVFKYEANVVVDERPQLAGRRKLFWLGMYVLMSVVLFTLTVVSHGYLPVGHR